MRIILFCFISLLLISPVLASPVVDVVLTSDVLDDYNKFIGDKDPLLVSNFGGQHARRDVVEVVLFQQALSYGGFTASYDFIIAPNYSRMLVMLSQGLAAVSANTLWLTDLKKSKYDLYSSEALIDEGEFEAGFYTVPTNQKALAVGSLEELIDLRVVSDDAWTSDWSTLTGLKLKNLYSVKGWAFMVRMVANKRADFLLAPFQSSDDLSFEAEGYKFVPLQNFKLGLRGSRHLAVSKSYPNAEEIYESLNKGINILRDKGIIAKAYSECGFFNEKVKNWKKLN